MIYTTRLSRLVGDKEIVSENYLTLREADDVAEETIIELKTKGYVVGDRHYHNSEDSKIVPNYITLYSYLAKKERVPDLVLRIMSKKEAYLCLCRLKFLTKTLIHRVIALLRLFVDYCLQTAFYFFLNMGNYILYTDGAYSSARDQGGIGILFLKEGKKVAEYSRMYKNTTNIKMELIATITGLKAIKKPINSLTIYTDSMYVIGCAVKGWKRKANKEYWTLFDKEYSRVSELCPKIEFIHVDGHGRDNSEQTRWNNYVDELAVKASKEIE